MSDKLPPHDLGAEEALLGSLLLDPYAIRQISILEASDFYGLKAQLVFTAIKSLEKQQAAIDQISVAQELNRTDKLESIGGPAYLAHILSVIPTSLHAHYYAQIVRRLATCRKLIDAAGQIAQIAYASPVEIDKALNQAEDIIFKIREASSGRSSLLPIKKIASREIGAIGNWLDGETGISTGFRDLDRAVMGLQPQNLYTVGGYTGVGKSQFALAIALNVLSSGFVAFFSLEMSGFNIIKRICQTKKGLHSYPWDYSENDKVEFMQAYGESADLPFYLDDSGNLEVSEAMSKVKQLQSQGHVALVVFDYINLAGEHGRDKRERIDNTVQGLKTLAKVCNVPVIAVAQFNRMIASEYIPTMSHLKESGGIEQMSDYVMLLNHWDYYLSRKLLSLEQVKRYDNNYEANRLDIYLPKVKEGQAQKIELYYDYKNWKIASWVKRNDY